MYKAKFHARCALVIGLCASVANANDLPAQSRPRAAALTSSQRTAIDSFVLRTMQSRRIPGVAAAVVYDGAVVYRNAFGVANLETESPLSVNSVFELASVTKQFTAAAIMMLVEEGKVQLDASITTYIDSAPPTWSPITVRQLLTHTSGIFAGGIVRHDGSPLLVVTTKQAFQHVAAQRVFPPGDVGFYSDAGYFLLGMIIEKASGQTYRQFLQRRIFEPLQMTHSSITDRRRLIEGRVSTYEIADSNLVNWRRDWDYELPSFFGIWSTLDDLAKWDTGLRRNTLLTQASLDQMWTPAKLNDGRDALVDSRLYGFGFRLGEIRGHRVVSHTGASGTLLLHLLEEPLTVIVLTNLSNTAGRHGTILGNGIVGLLRPAYTPVQKLAVQPDPTPETTRALQTLLGDVAADRESPVMTAAHATYFRRLPPVARDPLRDQLGGLSPLSFVACDDVTGKNVRVTDAISRICYYKAKAAAGRMTYVTFWLTRDGKAAHMRLDSEDDY
jgi:CubicO group peptidase (beta-lactamase class C family)